MVAFGAGDELGLVLAGGYAVSAHHLTDRPSRDHEQFLAACLQREVAARDSHDGEGRIRAAKFPARKALGGSLLRPIPQRVGTPAPGVWRHHRSAKGLVIAVRLRRLGLVPLLNRYGHCGLSAESKADLGGV